MVQTHANATLKSKTCNICGDEIDLKENGEMFVACHVCGFPVCQPCYDYERAEGQQSCPQCHTRYKRHKGSSALLQTMFHRVKIGQSNSN